MRHSVGVTHPRSGTSRARNTRKLYQPKTQTLISPIYVVPIHPMVLLEVGVISITSQQRRRTPGSGSWFGSTQHGDADEGPLPRTTAHGVAL